jgi:hypothetical protein
MLSFLFFFPDRSRIATATIISSFVLGLFDLRLAFITNLGICYHNVFLSAGPDLEMMAMQHVGLASYKLHA